jgi:adenylate kinase family enzyme
MCDLISNWISAAIGAGLIVSIINWISASRKERRERHITILREQIQHLYGPIYYLVSQNKTFFQTSHDIHKAGEKVYSGIEWAPSAQQTIEREITDTIETANKYIELVEKNNEKIMDILNNNIHLAEIEDYENFSIFVKDYFRLQIETGRILRSKKEVDKTDSDPKLPFRVVLKLPRISFLDENFIEMVETRFFEIKNEYKKYCK